MNATAIAQAPFVSHDDRFPAVLGDGPSLEKVVDTDAHEGPVYAEDEDALYFTTVPRRRDSGFPYVEIKRLALDGVRFPLEPRRISVVRAGANAANGMTMDRDGRLVVCEQGTLTERARIARVERATGEAETVVDAFAGLPFNSPNDVVVTGDGSVWFTDPSYGHLQGFKPEQQLPDQVYRHDPATGETEVAASGFDKPNGLVFSPDGRILYVSDNGAPHHLLAYDVAEPPLTGRALAVGTPEHPDGLAVDAEGRIYASASTGIQVFAPDGALLGEIALPGAVNFCFGGPERNVLFITADTAIHAARLNAKGVRP